MYMEYTFIAWLFVSVWRYVYIETLYRPLTDVILDVLQGVIGLFVVCSVYLEVLGSADRVGELLASLLGNF